MLWKIVVKIARQLKTVHFTLVNRVKIMEVLPVSFSYPKNKIEYISSKVYSTIIKMMGIIQAMAKLFRKTSGKSIAVQLKKQSKVNAYEGEVDMYLSITPRNTNIMKDIIIQYSIKLNIQFIHINFNYRKRNHRLNQTSSF